jgi:hypothetical protein
MNKLQASQHQPTKRKVNLESKKPVPQPESIIKAYRDLTDLNQLMSSKPDHFWCCTHLADLPLGDQSPDPRYCKRCYTFLMAEYKNRNCWWVPVKGAKNKTPPQVLAQGALIMSTSKCKNSTVDTINPTPPANDVKILNIDCSDGRGRKPQSLPIELIKQYSLDGMGSKAIATKLKNQGLSVSYKTVQRRLKKEDVIRTYETR